MIAVIRNYLVVPSHLILAAILLSGCGTTDRSDRQNDCARARARYGKMKQTVKGYYAVGTTSSVQIAIAERRLAKAKQDYQSACGRGSTRGAN